MHHCHHHHHNHHQHHHNHDHQHHRHHHHYIIILIILLCLQAKKVFAATHEVVTEPITVTIDGATFQYDIPYIKDASDFNEALFNASNKGQCYRKRTDFDDYVFSSPHDGQVEKKVPSFLQ